MRYLHAPVKHLCLLRSLPYACKRVAPRPKGCGVSPMSNCRKKPRRPRLRKLRKKPIVLAVSYQRVSADRLRLGRKCACGTSRQRVSPHVTRPMDPLRPGRATTIAEHTFPCLASGKCGQLRASASLAIALF